MVSDGTGWAPACRAGSRWLSARFLSITCRTESRNEFLRTAIQLKSPGSNHTKTWAIGTGRVAPLQNIIALNIPVGQVDSQPERFFLFRALH